MGASLIVVWALAAALLVFCVLSAAGDVTYVTLADGRKQERSLPTIFKLLLPFVGNFSSLTGSRWLSAAVADANRRLVRAGYDGVLSGEEFVSLKLMLLWVFPEMWLRAAIRRRHLSIQRALPFVLDLLTLSVEAGMDFISALQRNCKLRKLDALNEELLRMTKEIQVGRSRREALREMAERVGQPDLRMLANSLVQADELGVSIGAMLRIQSDQLRSRRFDRAEKLAAEAPVKMLGPLMLCIFPAVFIIMLGPIISQAMKGMF